jgi:hypothetical protein
MIGRLLKIAAACALLVLPAAAEETSSLEAEIARIIRVAYAQGPYRSWDALRVAMPRSVRWHLVPPDRDGARLFRRSGWIERNGSQAGVAACGDIHGPELLTLRIHSGESGYHLDAVIEALEQQGDLRHQDHQPTMVGEIDRYELGASTSAPMRLRRELDCPMEGRRGIRGCTTGYMLDIRPPYASAPTARDCVAP